MTTLPSGIINKLNDGMKNGVLNPMGDHRTALLQVTDIMPIDLDEKALWPKHGFYIKLSDSTESVYASLPADQSDLVLSNKIQLGQFINLDRLEHSLPVPVIIGCKPLPGRHPVMSTPDPIRMSTRSIRRGSWGAEPEQTRPVKLDFEEKTPAKEMNKMLRKSCVIPKAICSRSKSVTDRRARVPPKSRYNDDKNLVMSTPKSIKRVESSSSNSILSDENENNNNNSSASIVKKKNKLISQDKSLDVSTPASRIIKRPEILISSSKSLFRDENEKNIGNIKMCKNKLINSPYENDSSSSPSKQKGSSGSHLTSLPGKLNTLGKEAIQQRDAAQKAAHKALRDMTASDNVVRILRMFSELNRVAKPDNPSLCFEQFLSFHQEIIQAIKDIETIHAATNNHADVITDSHVLQELAQNTRTPGKRRPVNTQSRPVSDPDRSDSNLETCLKMVKEIESEAGNWFVEYLDLTLEAGLKKAGNGSGMTRKERCVCPQSLMLRVVNWIEMEGKKKLVHPKTSTIARRLRIKAKNPAN